MQTINVSEKRFSALAKYDIPNYVYNTEGTLYVLPIKNKWETQLKLLKRLFLTNGEVFGNKLSTINSLIDNREKIGRIITDEIVFPEKIAVVDGSIVGFTMPLIESINLKTALISNDISNEMKISYLKQIGELLEKMHSVREYSEIEDFYINDLHESNFIVDTDNRVRAIDIDSCKINGNKIFNSKYLSSKSFISQIYKYQKNDEENRTKYKKDTDYKYSYRKYSTDVSGAFIPDENTDIYCYMMIILNFLYGDNIGNFSLEEFYDYLEYLNSIGFNKELLSYFEKVASNSPNENPYELLDSIIPYIGRSNYHVYNYIKKKSSNK